MKPSSTSPRLTSKIKSEAPGHHRMKHGCQRARLPQRLQANELHNDGIKETLGHHRPIGRAMTAADNAQHSYGNKKTRGSCAEGQNGKDDLFRGSESMCVLDYG